MGLFLSLTLYLAILVARHDRVAVAEHCPKPDCDPQNWRFFPYTEGVPWPGWLDGQMSRRDALGVLSGWALAGTGVMSLGDVPVAAVGPVGFRSIRLVAPDLERMQEFYGSLLGLPVRMEKAALVVTAGSTELSFAKGEGAPKYHFAFNIPENRIEQARDWVKKRTPITLAGGREIVHFESWNAHATYFFDPAGNIVEFIARHTLSNASKGAFSQKQVLYASELGLVVEDVPSVVTAVGKSLGLKPYKGTSPGFTAVGDEHALLIVVQKGRLWFGSKDLPAAAFEASASVAGTPGGSWTAGGYSVRVG